MSFVTAKWYGFDENWKEVPGIYGIATAQGVMIYIGETDNLRRRMSEHQSNWGHPMHRYGPALVKFEADPDAVRRRFRESQLIDDYDPPANA